MNSWKCAFVLIIITTVLSGSVCADSISMPDGMKIYGAVSNDGTGAAVRVADINKDGLSDIILGSPTSSPYGRSNAGSVTAIYGRTSDTRVSLDLASLTNSIGFKINGAFVNDSLGFSLDIGDVNGGMYL